ncbi:hypothetical protein [Ulvibacterium sp.]|uniref:hypothetical protein n=1 Tax=Ulvibacterium sp. TaxID=2665914 RepID=UPI00260F600F|nr:hypothetical protein [Ulvibacterium sp.]
MKNKIQTHKGLVFFWVLATCILINAPAQSVPDPVDIRPREIRDWVGDATLEIRDRNKRGRQLLNECFDAHGWVAGNSSTISATYIDDWSVAPEPLRRYNNWPYLKQALQHDFLSFKLGHSRAQLLNGPSKGEIWGIDHAMPYKIINGEMNRVEDSNMVPALVGKEYFIQLPYWTKKVPLVAYVKDTVHQGQPYHLVFGTWETPKVNPRFDQYVYWINQKTKLLEIVQYTVRVVDPSAVGFVVFDDFREVDGVSIPFVHRLGYLPTSEGLIHEMRFQSVVLDPKGLSLHLLGNLREKEQP